MKKRNQPKVTIHTNHVKMVINLNPQQLAKEIAKANTTYAKILKKALKKELK